MTAPALFAQQQGAGAVTADNMNTWIQGCANVSQLRGFTGLAGMHVFVDGYVTPNDGGAGLFYWNPSSTAADNGINVIVPTGSSSGAWNRVVISSPQSILVPATITSAAGLVLPAGNIVGGMITRAGAPGAGFTDTTDTAANIIAQIMNGGVVGNWIELRMLNTTGQTQTLGAGAGVSLFGTLTTAANAKHIYTLIVTGAATVSIYG